MNKPIKVEEVINRTILQTPFGKMEAMATDKGLCVLEFFNPKRRVLLEKRLEQWFSPYRVEESLPGGAGSDILEKTAVWLENYFAKGFAGLERPLLDLRGSEFELKVWGALLDIPLGETRSYGEVARVVGQPHASRAVGNANRRNPVAIIVPCHRVIGSDRKLVGYGGGLPMKQNLLDLEQCSNDRLFG